MKGLWLDRIALFRIKTSVQIVENASSPFSFRNCPCTLSYCFNESKEVFRFR